MKISISGIRGIYGKDLLPNDILKFCNGFSKLIKDGKCAIGRDTRTSGEIIEKLVSAVLLERGIDVYNLGIVPTPVVFRKAKEIGAGIVITSSHNPIEWNGLKFILNGRGIDEEELEFVKNGINEEKVNVGREIFVESEYISDAVEIVGKVKQSREVVVDIGGGAAKNYASQLLKKIGCNVTTINEELEKCSRGPDPTSDNLKELINETKDIGLSLIHI